MIEREARRIVHAAAPHGLPHAGQMPLTLPVIHSSSRHRPRGRIAPFYPGGDGPRACAAIPRSHRLATRLYIP